MMWKRLIIFLMILFCLMFIISGIYAKNQTIPATTESDNNFEAKAIFNQGIAVDNNGFVILNQEGEKVFWNHPNKYFCPQGYLRICDNDEKIVDQMGRPINKSCLYQTPELTLTEQILHEMVFP